MTEQPAQPDESAPPAPASGAVPTPATPEPPPAPPPAATAPAAESGRAQHAVDFALALVHEDDLPASQIRVFGEAVVAIAPDETELDRLVAAVLLTPARARFRDVVVSRAVDPLVQVDFEREGPAVATAREKLWRILRQLDDEIAQASSAAQYTPKGAPGKQPAADFLRRLHEVRGQISRYHGLCYANTLMDTHERITTNIIRRAVFVARSAGIKVSFQE